MEDIIVIVGPTGVGKTKLSIELAKIYDAEIINGDSVSIYKGLDIGSAKPTILERDGIIHHLIDICDVNDNYTVFDYQRDTRNLIDDIISRGKRVIIVGGSGLYIKAALYDYRFEKEKNNNSYDNLSNQEIMDKILKYTDKVDVHINNRRRLVRILNKYENNENFTSNKDQLLYPCKVIGLTTKRDILYERINKRVDLMIKNNLIGEVNGFKMFYKTSRILNSAIGYKEFYDYLFNGSSVDDVVSKIKLDSRRYAKRQYTFFKHQFNTVWFDVNFDNFSETVKAVSDYIKNNT